MTVELRLKVKGHSYTVDLNELTASIGLKDFRELAEMPANALAARNFEIELLTGRYVFGVQPLHNRHLYGARTRHVATPDSHTIGFEIIRLLEEWGPCGDLDIYACELACLMDEAYGERPTILDVAEACYQIDDQCFLYGRDEYEAIDTYIDECYGHLEIPSFLCIDYARTLEDIGGRAASLYAYGCTTLD